MMKKYKKIYVEITNVCNLKCTFCPETKRKPAFMTEEIFTQILQQLKPFTDYLYLHVKGEPLLHPELGRFLEICHEKGFQVNLTTNGTLIDKAADVLLTAPALRQINFSLHSFDGNTQQMSRDAYLDSILYFTGRAMRETKIIVSLRLWNLDEALLTEDQRKRNAGIMQAVEDYFRLPYQIQSRLSGKSLKIAERVYLNQDYEFVWPDLYQETGSSQGTCYGLRDQVAILVDGSVVPCCLDGEGKITLGNILAEPFADIINNQRADAIRSGFCNRQVVEELCRKCGYRKRFD